MSVDGHKRFLDITTCDFLRSLRQQHHRLYSFLFSSFHVSNKTCKPAKKPNNIPREKRVEDLRSSKQFALHDRFPRDRVSLQCHKGQRYSAETRKQKFAFHRNTEYMRIAHSFFTDFYDMESVM